MTAPAPIVLCAPLEPATWAAWLLLLRDAAEYPWPRPVVYAHSRVAGYPRTPSECELRLVARRLIDGAGALNPRPALAVGIGSMESVTDQLDWAEAAGVPTSRISETDLGAMLRQAARDTASSPPLAMREPGPAWDLRSPEEVIRVYFRGAECVCGARALDYGAVRAGAHYTMAEAQVRAGLRVAQAGGIVTEASAAPGWRPETMPLLKLVYVDGLSYEAAGLICEVGGETTVARRDRARRICARGIGRLGDVLRERRRCDHGEGQDGRDA